MIQTEACGVLRKSAAMAGSAVLAMAVSSVASATAIMIAAMPRFSRGVMALSSGGCVAGLGCAEDGWLAGVCTVGLPVGAIGGEGAGRA
ncbi:hypothetical protein D3C86_1443190 [compost metagenome]